MDWTSVAILAVIMGVEGVRRVPPDAVVLRRSLLGPWEALSPDPFRNSGWQFVALWPPFMLPLILSAPDPRNHDVSPRSSGTWPIKPFEFALSSTRWGRALLRGVAGAIVVSIVLVVPWTLTHFGAWGFAGGLCLVMALSLTASILSLLLLRQLGASWSGALRLACPLLSPFNAARAPEVVLEYAAKGIPPILAARVLLGCDRFCDWIRPDAYDALLDRPGRSSRPPLHELKSLLGADFLEETVAAAPPRASPGARYCPRCASVYTEGIVACSDCDAISLVSWKPSGTVG